MLLSSGRYERRRQGEQSDVGGERFSRLYRRRTENPNKDLFQRFFGHTARREDDNVDDISGCWKKNSLRLPVRRRWKTPVRLPDQLQQAENTSFYNSLRRVEDRTRFTEKFTNYVQNHDSQPWGNNNVYIFYNSVSWRYTCDKVYQFKDCGRSFRLMILI